MTNELGTSFQELFMLGANKLASAEVLYGPPQQAAGFTEDEWLLLTDTECWNMDQQMKMKGVLANAISICLRTAGLPATPLPGAYVASVICKLCAPCNRLVAAASAPESFDAMSASGLVSESVEVITSRMQMMALVTYFSSAEFDALNKFKIDDLVASAVIEAVNEV